MAGLPTQNSLHRSQSWHPNCARRCQRQVHIDFSRVEGTHLSVRLRWNLLKMNVHLFLSTLISVRFLGEPPDLWQLGGNSVSHGVPSRGAHKLAYYCKAAPYLISAFASNGIERMGFLISTGGYILACLWIRRCPQPQEQQLHGVQAN